MQTVPSGRAGHRCRRRCCISIPCRASTSSPLCSSRFRWRPTRGCRRRRVHAMTIRCRLESSGSGRESRACRRRAELAWTRDRASCTPRGRDRLRRGRAWRGDMVLRFAASDRQRNRGLPRGAGSQRGGVGRDVACLCARRARAACVDKRHRGGPLSGVRATVLRRVVSQRVAPWKRRRAFEPCESPRRSLP